MTAQVPDILIYEGKRLPLFSNPLEIYFELNPPRPDFQAPNTACWRGYVAEWEIVSDVLTLTNLDACIKTESGLLANVGIEEIFSTQGKRMEASWYTGELRVPKGELLQYVHMGYGSEYEEELILTIEKGRLIKVSVVDNRTKEREAFNPEQALKELLDQVRLRTSIHSKQEKEELSPAADGKSGDAHSGQFIYQDEHEIQAALERLKNGSYGLCENCNQVIFEGRLRLFPAARLCVRCQEEADRAVDIMTAVIRCTRCNSEEVTVWERAMMIRSAVLYDDGQLETEEWGRLEVPFPERWPLQYTCWECEYEWLDPHGRYDVAQLKMHMAGALLDIFHRLDKDDKGFSERTPYEILSQFPHEVIETSLEGDQSDPSIIVRFRDGSMAIISNSNQISSPGHIELC